MSTEQAITAAFLTEMYQGIPGDQWLTLFSIDRTSGRPDTRWHEVSDIEGMVEDAAEMAKTSCTWYGIATRKERLKSGRGGADDCVMIPAVWCDIDVQGPNHKSTNLPPSMEAARDLIASFPGGPASFVVETGGGLQPYWLLDEPMRVGPELIGFLDHWRQTWQDLSAERGWSIDNVWDVARILRVPGTFNRKNEPTLVTLVAS